ncbi:GNAT family N-acetyltransferase [Macrococcus brunensis]|uniref:GNAT family N-acetyltransferase n=1 Tax=Macrococcus brunensis TaxID=198483 RepID=UPI001EF13B7B|nr:GNAT family N-acetyltransferase [Macrococcus brunensis]ULG72422.1 GNAT family N-acetyltransferase [Macrococcus brunensis]ULG74676.1 GNAT family N-acetyltransferase [Macrococcus brunensis]
MYQINVMSESDKEIIVSWHYPAPYQLYDLTADDFNGEYDFFSVFDDDQLVGMLKLHYNEGTCHLGLGLRPDLTGKGHGQHFVEAAVQLVKEQGYQSIQLAVISSNERAIKVYERCGFVEKDYELMLAGDVLEEFLIMQYGEEDCF